MFRAFENAATQMGLHGCSDEASCMLRRDHTCLDVTVHMSRPDCAHAQTRPRILRPDSAHVQSRLSAFSARILLRDYAHTKQRVILTIFSPSTVFSTSFKNSLLLGALHRIIKFTNFCHDLMQNHLS